MTPANAPPPRWSVGRIAMTLGLALLPALALAYALGAWTPLPRMDRALVAGIALFPAWGLVVLGLGARGLGLARRRGPRPSRGLRSPSNPLFRLHLELGGAITSLAFLVCFSGAASVAARTLAAWERAPMLVRDHVAELDEQPLDRILAGVLREDPEAARGLVRLTPASEARPWVQVDVRDAHGSERVHVFDPRTGVALGEGREALTVLVELHRNLLVSPLVGEVVVAALGVLLAVVLVCGLATRRHWGRELLELRRRRLLQELHKLLGAWTFVFGIVVALTGSILGGTAISVPVMAASAYEGDRAALFRDVLAVERGPIDPTPHPYPALATRLEPRCVTDRPASHAWTMRRVTLQHAGLASGRTTVEHEGSGPWLDRGLVIYDAHGEVLVCRALRQQSGMLQLFYGTIAVHYAELGGDGQGLVEALWIVAGFALAAGALVGEAVRQRRLERRGSPPSRWTRSTLLGLGAGLPLATIALLLLSRIGPPWAYDPVVTKGVFLLVWASVWVSSIGPRESGDPWRHALRLLVCGGVGLLTTAAASVLTTGGSTPDLLWACMGVVLLGIPCRRRARRRTNDEHGCASTKENHEPRQETRRPG